MPLSETYSSIVEHLKSLSDLSSYNIEVVNLYDEDVYIALGNEAPRARVITFGNKLQSFKIDLTAKEAHVKHLMDGFITYQMSDDHVAEVQAMIAEALILTFRQPNKCKCPCHKPGAKILHAFPCCG